MLSSKTNKQAIILAGGKGSRLEPYTTCIPKPLMPIGDIPILDIVIRQLNYYGFKRIKIAVGHLAGLIQAYLGDGKRFGVKVEYSLEENILGTVGPISLIEDLDDNFLILNGDLITDLDFNDFFNLHLQEGNIATIGIYKKSVKLDLGVLELDVHKNIKDYMEKPTLHYDVSMGIYAFNRQVVSYIPKNEKYDFPDLVKLLIKNNRKISAYLFNGYWRDIGNHQDYRKVNEEFQDIRVKLIKNL